MVDSVYADNRKLIVVPRLIIMVMAFHTKELLPEYKLVGGNVSKRARGEINGLKP